MNVFVDGADIGASGPSVRYYNQKCRPNRFDFLGEFVGGCCRAH